MTEKEIIKKLKELRKTMKENDLAAYVSVSKRTIRRWFYGEFRISPAYKRLLETFLGGLNGDKRK